MKVVGFISEYNPFHYGHEYHLKQSLKKTGADYSIAIMSGSFLQRGEPSIVDKWTKAKMAVDNGVDLVIELPFIFASQSAEFFAYGGVKLLDSLNIVNYLSFGSELGDIDPLLSIAKILSNEPNEYKKYLQFYLDKGLSFSIARSNALKNYINIISPNLNTDLEKILKQSNNILGIEYLKALYKLKSKILPITIKRFGSDYNDFNISTGFASATGIRHSIKTKGLDSIKDIVPQKSFLILKDYINNYENFNYIENFNQLFLYLTRTLDSNLISKLPNIENGLENRIIKEAYSNHNISNIIDKIVTKRYPRTRIQRLFIHLLNQLDKDTFNRLYKSYPSYIRVLGANKNGLNMLRLIKKSSSLPIITKFADYRKIDHNNLIGEIIMFDKRSTDIFFLGLNSSKSYSNMDYYHSPYIK